MQVLLAHPGGPFFRNKAHVWSLPKGVPEPGEALLEAACREFTEETSLTPTGPYLELGSIRQKGGKIVHAWAFEGDCDPETLHSNSFELEWPPRSGRIQQFPEIDGYQFFTLAQAADDLKPEQYPLLERLLERLPHL